MVLILSRCFDSIEKINFFSNRWSILSVENENFLIDGSIPLVANMTDSIDRYYRYRSIADNASQMLRR